MQNCSEVSYNVLNNHSYLTFDLSSADFSFVSFLVNIIQNHMFIKKGAFFSGWLP